MHTNDNLLDNRARLNHLDVYKGIAILFVIVTHYGWTSQQRLQLLFPFWIDMAVPMFMVITGFVSAYSFQKRNQDLKVAYNPREILCKWLRFVIPYSAVYMVQYVVGTLLAKESFSLTTMIKGFLVGGSGPGGYYTPVMIQVVIIIPIIYHVIKKFKTKGLCLCFIANVLFEIVKTLIYMEPGIYRLCSLRYVFILSYGCYLYILQTEKSITGKLWYYIAGCLGVAYIVIFEYTNVKPMITDQWTTTSVFAVFFIVPLMMHLIQLDGVHNRVLELLGKASFNIFLMQMLYYWGLVRKVYAYVPNTVLRLGVNVLICCVLGVVFYKIENPITRRIIKRIRCR